MTRLFILLLIAACSTQEFKNEQDQTDVRTMYSIRCFTQASCIENAVMSAKAECKKEGKSYQFISRQLHWRTPNIKYRCL